MWTDRQRYVTLRALAMLAFAAIVVYLPEILGNCEISGQKPKPKGTNLANHHLFTLKQSIFYYIPLKKTINWNFNQY